jgi:hypothetical protein
LKVPTAVRAAPTMTMSLVCMRKLSPVPPAARRRLRSDYSPRPVPLSIGARAAAHHMASHK